MAWYDTLLDPLLALKSPDSKFIAALKDLKKAVDGTAKAVGLADTALREGWLAAADEDLEKMHVFARKLASFAGATERKSENDWIEQSGCNAFAGADTARALDRLLEARTHLRSLRAACDVLKPLVRIQFLKAHMNVKALARAVMPSMVALDAIAVDETETDVAAAVWNLDRALPKLQRAIDAVTDLRDAQHRFLVITRSDNPVRDATRIHDALAKPTGTTR